MFLGTQEHTHEGHGISILSALKDFCTNNLREECIDLEASNFNHVVLQLSIPFGNIVSLHKIKLLVRKRN